MTTRLLWISLLTLAICGCSEQGGARGRCRLEPDAEGQRAAHHALVDFVRETQRRGPPARESASATLHDVVRGINPDELEFLGRTSGEPGDLLAYQFGGSEPGSRVFTVLVSDDCETEITW